MIRNSILPISLCLLGLGATLAPSAKADAWDKKTFVTFSGSVEVPGAVLPAGKYVFKLVDSPSDRHIVRVMNERENKVFATILAIPAYRMKTPDKSVFTFYEMPVGQPEALKEWFYPGDNYGQEFSYSKKRAAEIALAQRERGTSTAEIVVAAATPVTTPRESGEITTIATAVEEPKPAVVTETTDFGASAAKPDDDENAVKPMPSDENAAVEPSPAPEPEPQAPTPSDDSNNVLPKTASDLYLIGLLGVLASLGAVSIRQYRRS